MPGLSLQAMRDVVNAARTKFYKGFKETQLKRDYVLQRWWLSKAQTEDPQSKLEWTLRRKSAQGSTEFGLAFKTTSYIRDTYDISLNVTPRTLTTHRNMFFDRIQMAFNANNEQRLWNIMKMTLSAAEEERAEQFERLLLGPCKAESDAEDGFLGLLDWFARSMDVNGVYVEQLQPARNGVYTRNGSGTIVSSIAGQDRALAINSRLRTEVCTHRGSMDDLLLQTLDEAVQDAGFRYIPELTGEKPEGRIFLLMDDPFARAYNRLLTKAGGPRVRDYFGTGPTEISGAPCIAVPSFNGHFLRPIIGLKPNNLYPVKFKGEFGVDGEEKVGHRMVGYPREFTWQTKAEDPSSMGFLCHGSFATGV